jgi:hypothetical protein
MYVIGGWGDGKARGANYEYDPASDKWTKKKVDAASGPPCGAGVCEWQDLRERWFHTTRKDADPNRRRMAAH